MRCIDTVRKWSNIMKTFNSITAGALTCTLIVGLCAPMVTQAAGWDIVKRLGFTALFGNTQNTGSSLKNSLPLPSNPFSCITQSVTDCLVKPVHTFATQHPYQFWSLAALTGAYCGGALYWWNKTKKAGSAATNNNHKQSQTVHMQEEDSCEPWDTKTWQTILQAEQGYEPYIEPETIIPALENITAANTHDSIKEFKKLTKEEEEEDANWADAESDDPQDTNNQTLNQQQIAANIHLNNPFNKFLGETEQLDSQHALLPIWERNILLFSAEIEQQINIFNKRLDNLNNKDYKAESAPKECAIIIEKQGENFIAKERKDSTNSNSLKNRLDSYTEQLKNQHQHMQETHKKEFINTLKNQKQKLATIKKDCYLAQILIDQNKASCLLERFTKTYLNPRNNTWQNFMQVQEITRGGSKLSLRLANAFLSNQLNNYAISKENASDLGLKEKQIDTLDLCIKKIEELEQLLETTLKEKAG